MHTYVGLLLLKIQLCALFNEYHVSLVCFTKCKAIMTGTLFYSCEWTICTKLINLEISHSISCVDYTFLYERNIKHF